MATRRDTESETRKKAATQAPEVKMRQASVATQGGRPIVITTIKELEAALAAGAAPDELEAEASAILDRVERELPDVEKRTERLMHRYGL